MRQGLIRIKKDRFIISPGSILPARNSLVHQEKAAYRPGPGAFHLPEVLHHLNPDATVTNHVGQLSGKIVVLSQGDKTVPDFSVTLAGLARPVSHPVPLFSW